MKEKKIERMKQHKRLLIMTSTIILMSLILTSVYWKTLQENPQPSPSPSSYPSPTPTLSPSSSPSPSPPPSPTPTPSSFSLPTSTPTPIDLYPQEIREYEGEYLSSINVFRENSIAGPQYVDKNNYHLTITGLVNETMGYSNDEVINGFQKYRKVVTLFCVEGWTAKILWEGFSIKDLMSKVGINPEAVVVIFYAYDGYSNALPLNYLINNDILIAYKMNNVTLPPERGFPFQLVAESNYGYKWVKWITKIELSDNADYLGYWESRGYPNDANLS
jgi:DMSO/TMAO reductase YedYZ molybdopterin-dependent catalytic subunit